MKRNWQVNLKSQNENQDEQLLSTENIVARNLINAKDQAREFAKANEVMSRYMDAKVRWVNEPDRITRSYQNESSYYKIELVPVEWSLDEVIKPKKVKKSAKIDVEAIENSAHEPEQPKVSVLESLAAGKTEPELVNTDPNNDPRYEEGVEIVGQDTFKWTMELNNESIWNVQVFKNDELIGEATEKIAFIAKDTAKEIIAQNTNE